MVYENDESGSKKTIYLQSYASRIMHNTLVVLKMDKDF